MDRAGGVRHYPGKAQKSTDEARRPPGTGPFCQPAVPMTPNHQNVELLGTDKHYDPSRSGK
jgi:hypothetical protein